MPPAFSVGQKERGKIIDFALSEKLVLFSEAGI